MGKNHAKGMALIASLAGLFGPNLPKRNALPITTKTDRPSSVSVVKLWFCPFFMLSGVYPLVFLHGCRDRQVAQLLAHRAEHA